MFCMPLDFPDSPATPDSLRWKPVVRGYIEGTEILTEYGFINLDLLYSDKYLGDVIPFRGSKYNEPGFAVKELEWGQWVPNDKFPRVASVDMDTGQVVFVRPSRFVYYKYDNRIVWFKAKGVNIMTTLFTDMWLKARYSRLWKFTLSDDVVRNRAKSFYYFMLDKFNVDMYGEYKPSLNRDGVDNNATLYSDIYCNLDSPISIKPVKHVSRQRIWNLFNLDYFKDGKKVKIDRQKTDVNVYNLDVYPHHNLIVRRARKDDNPRTPWVGNPIVVGDGYDKSLIRIESVYADKSVGKAAESYTTLRPDWKTLNPNTDSYDKE